DSDWLDRLCLTGPSSSGERVKLTGDSSRGLVDAVSVMGITGARGEVSNAAARVVRRTHDAGAPRVCVGLGISEPHHVAEIASYADGAIVGTALVSALRDNGPQAVGEITRTLVTGASKN